MKRLVIPVEVMSDANMSMLESKGMIERLMPSRDRHRLHVDKHTGKGKAIYESDLIYGSHALIQCAIDNPTFSSFATHPDHEEFILLGGVDEKDMYLLIALDPYELFMEKSDAQALEAADFICLKCVFNDPFLSFFIMKKGVPHGECALGEGRPTTFYVTEGSRLPLDKISLDDYHIILDIDHLSMEVKA